MATPNIVTVNRTPPSTCTVDGCDRRYFSSGYCTLHYQRSRNGISMDAPESTPRGELRRYIKSVVAGELPDDCVVWPYGKYTSGYGSIGGTYAHRVAYELHNETTIPRGAEVRHTCGKGHLGCFNPKHLIIGSHADNMRDAVDHGTMRRGVEHPQSKLTESDVLEIVADPRGDRQVAEAYNVNGSTIWAIRNGRTWSWLTGIKPRCPTQT